MSNDESIRKELERLQKENAELRSGAGSLKRHTVTEGEYKGNPTLTFTGPKKVSLILGLGKLRAIEAVWQDVVRFLAKHPDSAADNRAQQDDDKI